jgi:hypothetical protein
MRTFLESLTWLIWLCLFAGLVAIVYMLYLPLWEPPSSIWLVRGPFAIVQFWIVFYWITRTQLYKEFKSIPSHPAHSVALWATRFVLVVGTFGTLVSVAASIWQFVH